MCSTYVLLCAGCQVERLGVPTSPTFAARSASPTALIQCAHVDYLPFRVDRHFGGNCQQLAGFSGYAFGHGVDAVDQFLGAEVAGLLDLQSLDVTGDEQGVLRRSLILNRWHRWATASRLVAGSTFFAEARGAPKHPA